MSKSLEKPERVKPLLMCKNDVVAYLALSTSSLERLVAIGDLPKPRKLSQGRVAWLVEELDTWGRSRPVSDLLPPANSGQGRRAASSGTSREGKVKL